MSGLRKWAVVAPWSEGGDAENTHHVEVFESRAEAEGEACGSRVVLLAEAQEVEWVTETAAAFLARIRVAEKRMAAARKILREDLRRYDSGRRPASRDALAALLGKKAGA